MTEPAWLTAARRYIGFHEQPGNRGIEEFIRLAHTGHVGDAWCAIFANACLESVGFHGTRSPAARSFENNPHFTELTTPQVGAIVTFWRGSEHSGQGHVGFYVGEGPQVLGGNQSDQVCIERQDPARVTGYWWPKAQAIGVEPAGTRQVGITATVFGGVGDPNNSAYDGHRINDQELGVSLPFRLAAERPTVKVIRGDKSIICPIIDVGPWNVHDPYWLIGARPQAETGTDNTGRKTNRAGIDLTPAAARALGIDGKGLVDWEFTMNDTATVQPAPTPPPVAPLPIPGVSGGLFDATAFFSYISNHPDEAKAVLSFAVGLFNAANPQRAIKLPSLVADMVLKAPPAPPPAPAPTPALQRPSVQLSVLGGIATTVLQALGVVGMPAGDAATHVGTLSTLIPIASAVFGSVGGWASIAKVVGKIIAIIPK